MTPSILSMNTMLKRAMQVGGWWGRGGSGSENIGEILMLLCRSIYVYECIDI